MEELKAAQQQQFDETGAGDCLPDKTRGMAFFLTASGYLVSCGGGWIILREDRPGSWDHELKVTPEQVQQIENGVFPPELAADWVAKLL